MRPNTRSYCIWLVPAVALFLPTVMTGSAQDIAIDWWTLDSGGSLHSTGADFELSGTIGQPDAGVVMTGGDYELTGGFWAAPMESASPYYVADLNCDGLLDFFDLDPFVLAITDPAGYVSAYPGCDLMLADCNGDGVVDFFDIDAFVELVVGG